MAGTRTAVGQQATSAWANQAMDNLQDLPATDATITYTYNGDGTVLRVQFEETTAGANLFSRQDFVYATGKISTITLTIYTSNTFATAIKTITDTYTWTGEQLTSIGRVVS